MNKEDNILEIFSINEPILENIPLEVWTAFIATLYEKAIKLSNEK